MKIGDKVKILYPGWEDRPGIIYSGEYNGYDWQVKSSNGYSAPFFERELELIESVLIPEPDFASKANKVLTDIGRILISKNQAYGDSALNPVSIFSKSDETEGLKVRIDDKLSRVAKGNDYGEDTITDLIGYLVLLKIAESNE